MASLKPLLRSFGLVAVVAAALIAPAVACAAPVVSPDGLWTWSRPLPHGYRASAIAAPTPGTCFVAVGLSDVLFTRDGGSSWSWSRTGLASLASELTGVRFVSAQDGWAWGVDEAGPGAPQAVLLRTDDGGETWQEQLRTPGDEFADVRAFDSLSAWAVARDTERPERPVLFTTTDGGQNWAEVTPPADEDTTFAALAAVGPQSALLVETVWSTGAGNGDVVGSRMWRTSDGGAHWTAPLTLAGAEIGDVAFSSPRRGWAAGLAGSVWGTHDGGASWKRLYRSPGFLGLVAMDSIGDDVWAVGGQGSLHSFDGGVTWQAQAAVRGNMIAFSGSLDGWIASDNTYLRTMDGGQTWSRVTNAPQTALTKLVAVAAGAVWGAAGDAIRSPDGGRHWLRVTQRRQLNAVAAVSSTRAWAVGGRGVAIRTTDGGAHWVSQPTRTTAGLLDVCFYNGSRGWASGDKGTILRTVDGGRHWLRAPTGRHDAIVKVVFADASHGLALTAPRAGRAAVLRTVDGGRTWSPSRLPSPGDLPTAVALKASGHAVVLARSGSSNAAHVWRSSDAGRTWQAAPDLPVTDIYNDVAYEGLMLCAVGSSGVVVVSDDDAVSWSLEGRPAGRTSLTAVQFVDGEAVMIGGESGAVLTKGLVLADE